MRDWTAYEASQEEAAFGRWADEFLDELTARVDYVRAALRDEASPETPHDVLRGLRSYVNDELEAVL